MPNFKTIVIISVIVLLGLFGVVEYVHAQVVPAQNQIIVAPYGQGFVVSTSTSPTHKLGTSLIDLASSFITGILGVSHGGTGSSTLTGILKGNGTGAIQTAIPGTDYQPAGSYVTSVSGTATRISSTGGLTPVLDLITTAVTPGSYTNANLTVDAYGRLTAASNGTGGGGSGTVGTSSSETAGYFPVWTTTNGTPALLAGNSSIFQNSGNIGIGTTSPTSLLNLSASDSGTTITAASAAMLDITNSNSTNNNFGDLAFSQKDASGNTVVTSKIAGIQTSHTAAATSGVLAFLTRNAGTFAEKMRITSAGLVGIGTTSPNSALSIQTAGAGVTLERVLTLANNATGGLWTIYDGAGTSFAAGYLNICQGECSGTNYELQFQGFGVAQARGAFSAPAFDSSITGRGSSPILAWTNTGGNFNGTLDVGENYTTGNISLNNWIGGTGSWNIKRSDGTALALATLLNSNNNLGIGTSTPGTFISAGSSTNAINLDVYATSTLTHGLNITTGCFSVAGVCITGGGTSYTATYPVTLTGSAFGLAFGTTTSNTWAGTQTFTNAPVFSALGAGTVNSTSGGTIYNTATSTPTLGLGLSYSGTLGQLIGGASGALSIATSSLYTGTTGQVPYFSGTNALIGTSTLTVSSASYVGVATSSPFAPLSVAGDFQQYGNYAHFGSAVPLFKSPAQSAIELWGDDNTTNGVQVTIGNRNAGTSAYSGLNILNDRANSNVTNFAGLYLNSSTYSDTSFGTAEAFSNLLMLQNTLGATSFINSTTSVSSAYFNWIAGGSATSNEIARLTGAGNLGLGTSTPYAQLALGGGNLVLGAATAGGTPGDLFLPKLGTSAGSFLAVDASGKVIATTTPSGGGGAAYPFTPSTDGGINTSATSTPIQGTNPGLGLDVSATSWYGIEGKLFAYASSTNQNVILGIGAGGTAATTSATTMSNAAFGVNALGSNVSGQNNLAIGSLALRQAKITSQNVAVGSSNLTSFTGAGNDLNVGIGYFTMSTLVTGTQNVAIGSKSLGNATSGDSNVAIGHAAGQVGAGDYQRNTFVGALTNQNPNTFILDTTELGYKAGFNNTGWNSTFLGEFSGQNNTTGKNNITIGYNALVPSITASNQLNIGNMIFGSGLAATSSSATVIPTPTGNIGIATTTPWRTLSVTGTVGFDGLTTSAATQSGALCLSSNKEVINDSVNCIVSAKRYKENIKDLAPGLDELMQLRPVSFTWKKDFLGANADDPNQSGVQYSLIADEVQKIDPNLISLTTQETTFEGKVYPAGSVNGLADVNHWVALLVKSIQEIANTNNKQDAEIAELKAQVAALQAGKTMNRCSL